MPHVVHIEHFEGPLDLLLQLVEQEKLDISQVSLASVAEQFVAHVRDNPSILPEELADFLVVAAKLMYLKSKLLVPEVFDAELEEGPDLETQLREYRRFVMASRHIAELWKTGNRSFLGASRTVVEAQSGFVPPSGITVESLLLIMRRVISRLEPLLRLPQASLERAVTIQEKIRDLYHLVSRSARTSFQRFLAAARNKNEAVVAFLALLELVKQRFVRVEQAELFQDIQVEKHEEAGDRMPINESGQ